MASTYTAWNGDEYPWPPPEGWEQKSDGRYWPADRGPDPTPAAPAPPPPTDFGAVPPPIPPPSARTMPPPGALPPPGGPPSGGPPPGAPPPPQQWAGYQTGPPQPQKGSNRTTFIVLGIIFGILVLGVGGCIVALATLGDEIVNTIESFGEETQEAVDSIEFEQCGVVNGELIASGSIENRRDVTSSYDFTIVFVEPDGTRSKFVNTEVNNLRSGESDLFRATYGTAPDIGYRCEVSSMFLEPFPFGD